MNNSGMAVRVLLVAFLLSAVAVSIFFYLEWEKPQVKLDTPLEMIGQHTDITITLTDLKSGIRRYTVSIVQDEQRTVVATEEFPDSGLYEKTVDVQVNPRQLKIHDGDAVFRVEAVDFSPLKNTTVLEVAVGIDSIPPQISLLTSAHNVNPGGTCLVIYTVSKEVVKSGVLCDGEFFPGYLVEESGKKSYVCYFAIPMDVERATPMAVMGVDRGGNETRVGIPFYVRKAHTFRSDTVSVSTSFITQKAVEFQQRDATLSGKSPLEMFVHINTTLRAENDAAIRSICEKTDTRQLWQGAFSRMENAATMARFGDRRTYTYEGKPIGESIHYGIDLASTMHAPVSASNSGTVIFAEPLGIYGNSVVIDHGQGIMSLYSHLSAIGVQVGQAVEKSSLIGNTGATGFAGGDHLHFSILVGGRYVNPIEWWDSHWIQDNVEKKLRHVFSGT